MQTAQIVVGLGFGDEGKGKTVDYLSQLYQHSIVVRFSGGQQAGHTVIKDGIKHIFSNYGSGTFNNCPTYFSEHTSIYLYTINNEREILLKKGINPNLIVHPLTKLTTPYDVAYNRITEKQNGHGSCGLGIAATMKRHIDDNYKLYAIDLLNLDVFKAKLEKIRDYYTTKLEYNGVSKFFFYQEYYQQEHQFNELIQKHNEFFHIETYEFLKNYYNIVFEGSQGIMLDMDHGIFPNVTYANTTCKNALDICKKIHIYNPHIYYTTRCYQTRHGNGWMSDTPDIDLINNEEEINITNQWQGNFKVKEIDYKLINYALEIDKLYYDNFNPIKNLVISCLDQRPGFKFNYNQIKSTFNHILESFTPKSEFKEKKKVF